jgi:hypothetical protein
MIVLVPAAMLLIAPADPTVATDVLLLLHEPPLVRSLTLTVDPAQTTGVPRMTLG